MQLTTCNFCRTKVEMKEIKTFCRINYRLRLTVDTSSLCMGNEQIGCLNGTKFDKTMPLVHAAVKLITTKWMDNLQKFLPANHSFRPFNPFLSAYSIFFCLDTKQIILRHPSIFVCPYIKYSYKHFLIYAQEKICELQRKAIFLCSIKYLNTLLNGRGD